MGYQPIENYGVVGDLNTVALVGINGSIDYMCFPELDSPSIFAALLDKDKGGYFSIHPILKDYRNKQMYLPDTNVLLTRFLSSEGVAEITDFMPVAENCEDNSLVRRVTCIRGEIKFVLQCCPRFNYARSEHETEALEKEVTFRSKGTDGTVIKLKSTIPLEIKNGDVETVFTLKSGQKADFVLEDVDNEESSKVAVKDFAENTLFATMNYWKDWVSKSTYRGRWMEIVNRSALVLKLLTSRKYGSVAAAATFGLPEGIGGERNWDYRYTWIRDASFTMYAFLSLGYSKEASRFISWVEKRCQDIGSAGYMGLMYKMDGSLELDETILPHLEGYRKSSPVRIGNGAHDQLQLDIYGELMDAVYLFNKYGEPISYDFWNAMVDQINWLCDNWQRPDEGIWEVRGGQRHFLYSRMMCWVALDRAIRLGESRPFTYPERWKKVRDAIYNSVFDDFWNEEKQCFVQSKGSETVDGATLLMPLIRFLGARDPRWLSTLEVIENELVSDSLVYRYRPETAASDGLEGEEGTFSMCTFWYVECLARAGEIQKARFYFEKMLGYANHLGLYAEQLGFEGEHLGNFPQAFTHLGLISAAISLDTQLNDQRNRELNDNAL